MEPRKPLQGPVTVTGIKGAVLETNRGPIKLKDARMDPPALVYSGDVVKVTFEVSFIREATEGEVCP